MNTPNIENTMIDKENGIVYKIIAYRKMSREEMVILLKTFFSSGTKKKPKRGQTIEIISTFGLRD